MALQQDLMKPLKGSVVETIVLWAIATFLVNGFVAPALPQLVSSIPLGDITTVGVALFLAVYVKNLASHKVPALRKLLV